MHYCKCNCNFNIISSKNNNAVVHIHHLALDVGSCWKAGGLPGWGDEIENNKENARLVFMRKIFYYYCTALLGNGIPHLA